MDKWHVYGTLELNDPHSKCNGICHRLGINPLPDKATDTLGSISVNRWRWRTYIQAKFDSNFVFCFNVDDYGNSLHKCINVQDQVNLRCQQFVTIFEV